MKLIPRTRFAITVLLCCSRISARNFIRTDWNLHHKQHSKSHALLHCTNGMQRPGLRHHPNDLCKEISNAIAIDCIRSWIVSTDTDTDTGRYTEANREYRNSNTRNMCGKSLDLRICTAIYSSVTVSERLYNELLLCTRYATKWGSSQSMNCPTQSMDQSFVQQSMDFS